MFYIYTLGCKVNTYESSFIEDSMINAGFVKTSKDKANIFIINTCFVTNVAGNKSLKIIRQAKRLNKDAIVVVCGCLSQMASEEVKKIGVDIIIGNKDKSKIVDYIKKYKEPITKIYDLTNVDFEDMELSHFEHTRAFVKIQDGCNNFCSYCIIPYTRGGLRSKNRNLVLNEVKNLVNDGHKEIVLTGIHTGSYDDNGYHLYDLLKDILKIKGLERLRLSSIEITEINDDIINLMKENEVLTCHLHIPLQSGSDRILKLMNRKYDIDYFIDKVSKIREARPNISLTTDVIVGFPGETVEDFEEMVENIKRINFSKLHVFPYSLREGTKASLMEGQIDENTKKIRSHKLLELSKQLEIDYMNKFIGEKVLVLFETYKDGYLYGHTSNYLSIKCKGSIDLLKQISEVTIDSVSYPYCLGQVCETNCDKCVII